MNNIFPPTWVIRHKRENLRKCTLAGLEGRPDFCFHDALPPADAPYVLLAFEGPQLSSADCDRGLVVLDATWRYAAQMAQRLGAGALPTRSLPEWVTAYPRRQADCPDPVRGLASIEAIYVAYTLLGRSTEGLLDHYYWRDVFLERNNALVV